MKILFMLMSCNQEFFHNEEIVTLGTYLQDVRTYLRDINNTTDKLDWVWYSSYQGHEPAYDDKSKKLYVDAPDKWDTTFVKTKRAFEWASKNCEYDYIVRCNLSTWVNVPLLYNVIKYYIDANHLTNIFTTELCYAKGTYYGGGNFLIFNKQDVQTIIDSDVKYETMIEADDYVYGLIFNDIHKFHVFEGYNLFNKNGSAYNHQGSSFEDDILNHIAISCRNFDFDSYPNKLTRHEHRAIEEYEMLYNLNNWARHKREDDEIRNVNRLPEQFKKCISYKNKLCFYNNVGTKLIQ